MYRLTIVFNDKGMLITLHRSLFSLYRSIINAFINYGALKSFKYELL